jgi:hypothetical protein
MLRIPEIRRWRESAGSDQRFVTEVWHDLGLCDENGLRYTDDSGNVCLRAAESAPAGGGPNRLRTQTGIRDASVKALAEGIIGDRWAELFHPGVTTQRVRVMEAGPIGISPTMFADINSYTSVVAGMLERRILEQYQEPVYIGDSLFSLQQTGLIAGQKGIGIALGGDQAIQRLPTMPIKMATLGERWTQFPDTRENSLGVELSVEAVSQDLTGELMTAAADIGRWVRFRKEMDELSVFIGATNNYNYKGTAYNTYQASTPWINTQANAFTDWLDYDDSLQLLWNMRDPDTGVPIQIEANTVVVMPGRFRVHNAWNMGDMQQIRTQTQGQIVESANQFRGMFNVLTSNLLTYIATLAAAAGGLGLSASDAKELWWMGDPKRAFVYIQNEPFTTRAAVPDTYEMLSRRVVLAQFAWERGVAAVKDPRYIVKNTA